MKKQAAKPQTERKTIELVPSDDPRLAEVAGGRCYGWENGGWETVVVPLPAPQLP
jgi:hypothetical protein